MGVRGWTKARKRGHTIDPKQQSRTRYRNSRGSSRAGVFDGDHRAEVQPHPSPLLQCLLTPNRSISTSCSKARLVIKSTVTWVELDNLGLTFRVLLVTEMRREEMLVARSLVNYQFVTMIMEGPGL